MYVHISDQFATESEEEEEEEEEEEAEGQATVEPDEVKPSKILLYLYTLLRHN